MLSALTARGDALHYVVSVIGQHSWLARSSAWICVGQPEMYELDEGLAISFGSIQSSAVGPHYRHMQSTEGRREGVDVLVLAGAVGLDAPWTNGVPRPLLPLPISTLIESTLGKYREAFAGTCTICVNGQTEQIADRLAGDRAGANGCTPRLHVDHVPRGTAGCIRACQPYFQRDTIFVAGASVWVEDDLRWMLQQHRAEGNALSVYCTQRQLGEGGDGRRQLIPVGMYCCDRKVLRHIPGKGYFDLKEQLVPALRKAGLRVGAVILPGMTCEVSNWPTYLRLLSKTLSADRIDAEGYGQIAPGIWCGRNVHIAPQARIIGPVLLGEGCRIENDATIIGPAVLGDRCRVAPGAWVVRAVAPSGSSFAPNECVSDGIVPASQAPGGVAATAEGEQAPATARTIGTARAMPAGTLVTRLMLPAVLLVGAFFWAFSHTLAGLWEVWQTNADYSVGQLVPLAALYMAWTRRRELAALPLKPSLPGAGLFVGSVLVCVAGGYFLYSSLENVGMVLCANGLMIALVGWKSYRRMCAPLLFLFLMLPLPGRVHDAVMLPLQSLCARMSATVLETVGVPVERYGHILEVSGHQTAVAEACNGLRMAIAFLIVTVVVAYLINRPTWQKVVVVISSVPIALACNVTRIVALAYSYGAGYEWLIEGPLHDGMGLLMMPLALSLVYLELVLLSNLTVPPAWGGSADSIPAVSLVSGR